MNGYGWVTLVAIFFIGAFVGKIWPNVNVIGKVTGY